MYKGEREIDLVCVRELGIESVKQRIGERKLSE
jgi:hypothetical protein